VNLIKISAAFALIALIVFIAATLIKLAIMTIKGDL
jgi:hypothetical protein